MSGSEDERILSISELSRELKENLDAQETLKQAMALYEDFSQSVSELKDELHLKTSEVAPKHTMEPEPTPEIPLIPDNTVEQILEVLKEELENLSEKDKSFLANSVSRSPGDFFHQLIYSDQQLRSDEPRQKTKIEKFVDQLLEEGDDLLFRLVQDLRAEYPEHVIEEMLSSSMESSSKAGRENLKHWLQGFNMRGRLERTFKDAEHIKVLTEVSNNLIRECNLLRAENQTYQSISSVQKSSIDNLSALVTSLSIEVKKLRLEISGEAGSQASKVLFADSHLKPGPSIDKPFPMHLPVESKELERLCKKLPVKISLSGVSTTVLPAGDSPSQGLDVEISRTPNSKVPVTALPSIREDLLKHLRVDPVYHLKVILFLAESSSTNLLRNDHDAVKRPDKTFSFTAALTSKAMNLGFSTV